ncbi:phage/plasmid primase, P4 family [Tsukamurella tyrosinosolvens]|uniref:phage/plasmid primase, P4 family n=1 Tax=Tsukamurella tyrosinosolvens TaxID=57704 RepID=UPI000CA23F43|nr:phage/plasmid primase, P4 family [Tsukamurella tyrosinosolvens]AUN38635.1 hypothetical protein ASU32_00265 [Tsukamurella tyrosinosolvens]
MTERSLTTAPVIGPLGAAADPLASSRAMAERMAELKAQAVQVAAAGLTDGEKATKAAAEEKARAERAAAAIAYRGDVERYRPLIQAYMRWNMTLIRLDHGTKDPVKGVRWSRTPGLTEAEAMDWLARGGNLGVDLLRSRMIDLDAENAPATVRLMAAGFRPTFRTAKSLVEGHVKAGGSHTLLRAPEGVALDAVSSDDDAMQVRFDDGGLIDVLGGRRYGVLPPSYLSEVNGEYMAMADGGLHIPDGELGVAPMWLFDAAADGCPADLEAIWGALAPKVRRDLTELDARSVELTSAIDQVSWAEWIAGDARLSDTGEVDGCGCVIWRWVESDHDKSATLHEDCENGSGAHIWSGTMMAALGIGEHVSRLDLACALRCESRATVAASVGIRLGGEQEFDVIDADTLEELAAEAEAAAEAGGCVESQPTTGTRLPDGTGVGKVIEVEVGADGLLQRAQRLRSAATVMRVRQQAVELQSGAVLIGADSVVGASTAGATALALVEKSAPEHHADTSLAITGLPPVDPQMPAYLARAQEEVFAPAAPIDTKAGHAQGLLPADTRSLADAVAGPRATASPVDIEATDGQLAQAVAAAIGGTKLIYAADSETWYGWDGDRWAIDAEAARGAVQALLQRQGQATDAAERQRMIRAWTWKKLTNEQKLRAAKEWDGFVIDLETGDLVGPDGVRIEQLAVEVPAKAEETRTRNAVVAQLASNPRVKIRTEALDSRPEVIATPGAYLHLSKNPEAPVTATTPDPTAGVTKLLGAACDPTATCPKWDKLLADALPSEGVRRWLQKSYGQALFGLQEEHLVLVLEGQGGNGKGGVVDVLTAVFGDYAATLQTSVFTLAGMNNHSTDLMPLRGARFATADEVPPQQLNIDRVKKFSGGGRGSARLCGQDQTEWDLSHTLCLMTNNRLQWPPSAMQAMRRRLRVIKFEVAFGEPGFPPIIPGLAAAIVAEESSGVLNWLLEGWAMYVAEGLSDVPSEIEEWTQATLASSSSWSGFCDLAFEVTKDAEDALLSADIFPLWDYYRGQDTDQKHASPGSTRVVAAMLVEQLRGVTRIEARGKIKAGVRGVRWSEDGLALLEEMHAARFATPAFGPSVTPVVPPGM